MGMVRFATILAVALGATACSYTNHFLDDDEPAPNASYSTMKDVDAMAYDSWTYINLRTGETEVHPDATQWYYAGDGSMRAAQTEETVGIDWHIAIHRYEFKTNGASVFNTGLTDIEAVTELPSGTYAADRVFAYEDEVKLDDGYLLVMDMSGMMDGNIGYSWQPCINRVLCDGITRVATGGMPPTLYGTTEEVFTLRWDNGDWATLQITKAYGGNSGTSSGMMTFNYKYCAQ